MIAKPVSKLVQELEATSFTVIGSPCSDGYGGEALQYLHAGLTGAEGDFIAVLGDVSPLGRDPYYKRVSRFIDRYADRPVHVMRGNHDGPDFEEYFGIADRAVFAEEFTFIMLDNSNRRFSDDTLRFFWETMALSETRNIIVSFHIPPPNRISGDSMSVADWTKFEEAVGVWRNRISLLLCGHAHTYFEDEIDGLRLIVTGGGGANIRKVERVVSPPHHALEINLDENGRPQVRQRPLIPYSNVSESGDMQDVLRHVYEIQCRNYVTMRLRAEEEFRANRPETAHLYRAGMESSLSQARIIHRLLATSPAAVLSFEDGDGKDILSKRLSVAEAVNDVLSKRVLLGAAGAEKTFCSLLAKTGADDIEEDIQPNHYYLCGSCGVIFAGTEEPNYCSTCGAPGHSFSEVK